MNDERQKILMHKYLDGSSTLNEEKELMEYSVSSGQEQDSWFQYVKNQKKRIPEEQIESLWDNLSINHRHKRPNLIVLVLLITSIIFVFFYNNDSTVDSDYEKKNQLLQEAIALVEESQVTTEDKEIFYQDELVTIFLSYDKVNTK